MLLYMDLGASTGKEKYTFMEKAKIKDRRKDSQAFHKSSNPLALSEAQWTSCLLVP